MSIFSIQMSDFLFTLFRAKQNHIVCSVGSYGKGWVAKQKKMQKISQIISNPHFVSRSDYEHSPEKEYNVQGKLETQKQSQQKSQQQQQ